MSRLPTTGRDRAVRIELLRARAAIERQSVVHGMHDLGESLTPRGVLQSLFPRSRRGRSSSGLLLQAFTFSKRYPMLLSLGSALFSASARRRVSWWKLGAGAVIAWVVANKRGAE